LSGFELHWGRSRKKAGHDYLHPDSLHAQEDTMNTQRWLLPFTWGVDMHAIESAVHLAQSAGATLVAVSLVSAPHKPSARGARLEHIQQSKDFLEAVKWEAARHAVPVERYEDFTADVMQSITSLTHELHCEGIILATSGGKTLLLQDHEVKHLLIEPPASLVIVRLSLSPEQTPVHHPGTRFLSWLRGLWRQQALGSPVPDVLAREEPPRLRTEEHCL